MRMIKKEIQNSERERERGEGGVIKNIKNGEGGGDKQAKERERERE
jgi:hypothetical protein